MSLKSAPNGNNNNTATQIKLKNIMALCIYDRHCVSKYGHEIMYNADTLARGGDSFGSGDAYQITKSRTTSKIKKMKYPKVCYYVLFSVGIYTCIVYYIISKR